MTTLLARLPSIEIMKALSLMESDSASRIRPDVRTALVEATTALTAPNVPAKKVTVYIPSCHVHDNAEDNILIAGTTGQVYVLTLGVDLSGAGQDVNGVEPEKPSGLFSGIAQEASRYTLVSVTPVFHGIRDHSSLPLLGNGITLYGPKDPKGFLELHAVIMEDDGGYRHLGQVIEDASRSLKLPDLVKAAVDAASLSSPEAFALKNGIELLFHAVVAGLKNNRDDVIQDLHFSALEHQGYLAGVHAFDQPGARGVLTVEWT